MRERSFLSTWKDIWAYAEGAKGIFGMAVFCAIVSSGLSLLQPQVVNKLVNKVQAKNFEVKKEACTLVLLIVISAVMSAIQLYLTGRIGETVTRNARIKLSGKMLHLPIDVYSQHNSGEFVSRLTNDTTLIRSLLSKSLVGLLASSLTIIGCIGALLLIDPLAFILSFIIAASSIVIVGVASKPARKQSTALQKIIAQMGSDIQEAVSSIKFLRANCMESEAQAKTANGINSAYEAGMRLAKLNAIVGPLNQLAMNISLIAAIVVCGIRVASGAMSLANLVSFLMFFMMLVSPIGQLGTTIFDFQGALAGQDRMQQIYDLPELNDNLPIRKQETNVKHRRTYESETIPVLEFCSVEFAFHNEKQVLDAADFQIFQNEKVALLGKSGAGKTTLLSLIEQFHQPNSGKILFNGEDISSIAASKLRQNIGYVDQESTLLTGTIRENLNPHHKNIRERDYEYVIQALNLEKLIASLPKGLDTNIGDKGSRLSGGEKQRISIARVLLQEPKLLLLDEPTANLDVDAETAVLVAMQRMCRNSTILMVTHKPASVNTFDKYLLLDKGNINMSTSPFNAQQSALKIENDGQKLPQAVEPAEGLA